MASPASPGFGVRGHDDRGAEGVSIEAPKAPTGWGIRSGGVVSSPAGPGAEPRQLSHFLHILSHRTLLVAENSVAKVM